MPAGRPAILMQVESFLLPISEAFTSSDQAQPIFFQFLPTVEGDTESANYQEIGGEVIGRAESFSVYSNGSAKELTITAQFAAVDEIYDEYWVQRQVHRLQSLTKPIYDRENIFVTGTGKFFAPPLVIFTYGARYINVPVVVKSVAVAVPEGTMITPGDGLPQAVTVTISIKTNYPYGYVPGYINLQNLYPDDPFSRIDPSQMSFGGNVSVPTDVREILVDAALPQQPTFIETRGQRIEVEL